MCVCVRTSASGRVYGVVVISDVSQYCVTLLFIISVVFLLYVVRNGRGRELPQNCSPSSKP